MQRVRAALKLHSEELPFVQSACVAGAGAVGPSAASAALDQRPAHQSLEAQRT